MMLAKSGGTRGIRRKLRGQDLAATYDDGGDETSFGLICGQCCGCFPSGALLCSFRGGSDRIHASVARDPVPWRRPWWCIPVAALVISTVVAQEPPWALRYGEASIYHDADLSRRFWASLLGAFICSVGMLSTTANPPMGAWRATSAVVVVLVTLATLAVPALLNPMSPHILDRAAIICNRRYTDRTGAESWSSEARWIIAAVACIVVAAMAAAALHMSHRPSVHTRSAVRCVSLVWVEVVSECLDRAYWWCTDTQLGNLCLLAAFKETLATMNFIWVLYVVIYELQVFELTGRRPRARQMQALAITTMIMAGLYSASRATFLRDSHLIPGSFLLIVERLLALVLILCSVATMAVGMSGITSPMLMLWGESKERLGLSHLQARWATGILAGELAAWIALSLVLSLGVMHGVALERLGNNVHLGAWADVVGQLVRTMRVIAQACVLSFQNVLFWPRPPSTRAAGSHLEEAIARSSASHPRLSSSEGVAAAVDVEPISNSVTLEDLLEFRKRLGSDLMPHFDKEKSTTSDVMHQAIIPMTVSGMHQRGARARGGKAQQRPPIWSMGRTCCSADESDARDRVGTSLADLLNTGKPRRMPDFMLVYCVTSPFMDIISAVTALYLGKPEYSKVDDCFTEPSGVEKLKAELQDRGRSSFMEQGIWLAAFCVNLHENGVCKLLQNGPEEWSLAYEEWSETRRDSVTGKLHPICPCKEEVKTGAQFAALSQLRAALASFNSSGAFQQIVMVDEDFKVFTRIWCLFELTEAARVGARQSAVIHNSDGFEAHFQRLAVLSISTSRSASPTLGQESMRWIPDEAAFDEHLMQLLCGPRGLLGKWLSLEDRASVKDPRLTFRRTLARASEKARQLQELNKRIIRLRRSAFGIGAGEPDGASPDGAFMENEEKEPLLDTAASAKSSPGSDMRVLRIPSTEEPKCTACCWAFRLFWYGMVPEAGDRLDPTSPWTYGLIVKDFERRRPQLRILAQRQEWETENLAKEELMVRQDFAQNKVRWFGEFWRDFWVYMRNHYPLTELLFSHPLFPVTRVEFYLIFGLDMVFTLWLATMLSDASACLQCQATCEFAGHPDCKPLPTESIFFGTEHIVRTEHMLRFCCIYDIIGLQTVAGLFRISINGRHFALGNILFIIVVNSALMGFLFNLVHCNKFQKRRRSHRLAAERAGNCLAGLLLLFNLMVILPAAAHHVYQIGGFTLLGSALATGIISRLVSWFFEFWLKMLLFAFLWKGQSSGADCLLELNIIAEEYIDYVQRHRGDAPSV